MGFITMKTSEGVYSPHHCHVLFHCTTMQAGKLQDVLLQGMQCLFLCISSRSSVVACTSFPCAAWSQHQWSSICEAASAHSVLTGMQDKTKEASSVVAEKAVYAKDKVGDVAVQAKDSVEDAFSSGKHHAQQQADQAKRHAEEQRQRDELERKKKKKQKKFLGIF